MTEAKYQISLRDLMSRGLSGIQGKLGALENKISQVQGKANSMSSAFGKVGGMLAGALSVGAIVGFGGQVIQTTAKVEGLSNAITFASGGAYEGNKSLEFLKKTSQELGTPLEAAYEGFKTIQGAMIGTGVSADETRKIFSQISTGVTAMNLGVEDSKGVFLALGQIMSKGKVQAEELRGQIGERIPGAFGIAARAMGMTTQELDKMMEDGKLLSKDFLPKFAAEIEKTFKGALPTAVNSLQANLNRFNNSWLELKTSIGQQFMPYIVEAVTMLNTYVVPYIGKFFEYFKIGVDWIRDNRQQLEPLINLLGGFGMQLYSAYQNSSSFRESVSKLWESLKSLWNTIKPLAVLVGKVFLWYWDKLGKVIQWVANGAFRFLAAVLDDVNKRVEMFLNFMERIPIIGDMIKKLRSDLSEGLSIKGGLGGGIADANFRNAVAKANDANNMILQAANRKSDELNSAGIDGVGKKSRVKRGSRGGSISDVASGRPTHITININKLVESVNTTVNNMTEFKGKIRDVVSEALLTAVNDVNIIAGR